MPDLVKSLTDGCPWEDKAWGRVAHIFRSHHTAISYLEVKAGTRCSRHYHKERANVFWVRSGFIIVEEWDHKGRMMSTALGPGASHCVPSLIEHRFRVLEDGVVVETYYPDNGGLVDFNDINRRDVGGLDVD